MDSFLQIPDQKNGQNKKISSNSNHVDKKRIQRLKKNFLPFCMREIADQKQKPDETSPKRNPAPIEPGD